MGAAMAVEAKAKVKKRHALAISQFHAWKSQNPQATTRERVEMFDYLVDCAHMEQALNANSR
jgi:hypothetical protein